MVERGVLGFPKHKPSGQLRQVRTLEVCLTSPEDVHLDLVFRDAEDGCYLLVGFSFDVSKLQTAALFLGQLINDVPYDVQLVFLIIRSEGVDDVSSSLSVVCSSSESF